MPNPDDFHAFKNTSGHNSSSNNGCSTGCLPWILLGVLILWLIGKLAG